jgi:hypothetical protein
MAQEAALNAKASAERTQVNHETHSSKWNPEL